MNAGFLVVAAIIFLLVVICGTVIMILVVNHKWGYTPEREQELEEQTESGLRRKRTE
ncbi:MAG: hypothetical protein Q4D32_12295 [Eubacteriales bacterium]|nr:hypothetical protein [Eubacteriales bacterium]